MAEIKLKPCPFCGGEANVTEYPVVGSSTVVYAVECMNFRCPNPDPTSKCYLTEEAAAEAWNKEDGEDDERFD